ncbi:hypothetical protein CRM22_006806 [Opisthorchis felineus]|uniref:Uncharacterized protein n=1 Tax=Opisthorchis felineus TaxID=147828 RepID=A0A4S2LKY0_OPIFE|nr:hypothetical protein CRM22_006806 [Opisthorchis felineus]
MGIGNDVENEAIDNQKHVGNDANGNHFRASTIPGTHQADGHVYEYEEYYAYEDDDGGPHEETSGSLEKQDVGAKDQDPGNQGNGNQNEVQNEANGNLNDVRIEANGNLDKAGTNPETVQAKDEADQCDKHKAYEGDDVGANEETSGNLGEHDVDAEGGSADDEDDADENNKLPRGSGKQDGDVNIVGQAQDETDATEYEYEEYYVYENTET